MSDKKKIIGKKKINKYTREDCEKELGRLVQTKSDNSIYGDHIRRRLQELNKI